MGVRPILSLSLYILFNKREERTLYISITAERGECAKIQLNACQVALSGEADVDAKLQDKFAGNTL